MFQIAKITKKDTAYAKIIADRMLSICERRQISINKLAEMSDVKQSTLDNLVNGRSFNPTIRTLHKVALAFSMKLSEFLDFPELNDYDFDDPEEGQCKGE